MSYYKKPDYKISSHAMRRYSERLGKDIPFSEIKNQILKHLENTYEGETYENGDKKLICFECSKTYFIVSSDNVVKTFLKK